MKRLWLLPVAALVLTGCSAEPQAQVRADVEAITLAANDRDADAVREEIEDLLATLRAQVANNEIARAEADRIRAIVARIRESAALLEPEESPSPSPSPSPEESPSESPSPSPEPSPTEEPSPSPEPSPTEDDDEEESPEPILDLSPAASESSPSPAAARSPAASSEPTPQPSQ